jgi:hypothetical protein
MRWRDEEPLQPRDIDPYELLGDEKRGKAEGRRGNVRPYDAALMARICSGQVTKAELQRLRS